jgi:hypothetical protein
MTYLNLPCTDDLERFLKSEAAERGFASPAEYVCAIMEAMCRRKRHAELAKTLVDRIDGPAAIDLTPEVWRDLQDRVRRRVEKQLR